MWRVWLSRKANRYLCGGVEEMLCSRAYREGWLIVPLLDFVCFWHPRPHCKACFYWEVSNGLLKKIQTDQGSTRKTEETPCEKQTRETANETVAHVAHQNTQGDIQ
ncbi:hypothetical protein ACMA5I_10225 [Paracoccaceae bacterium GXU_MW_L88]